MVLSLILSCFAAFWSFPIDSASTRTRAARSRFSFDTGQTAASRSQPSAVPPRNLHEARDSLSSTVASRRAQRTALWQDSSLFQDSFFAPDSRQDGFGNSEFSGLSPAALAAAVSRSGPRSGHGGLNGGQPASRGPSDSDVGGVVVDPAAQSFSRSRH